MPLSHLFARRQHASRRDKTLALCVAIAVLALLLSSLFATNWLRHAIADESGNLSEAADELSVDVTTADNGTKIHFLTFGDAYAMDVIILESNGRFGMIDAGEDDDYPDGSDPNYPWRDGIVEGCGIQDEVIAYMHELGINHDNFEFFIGTHAHSDHIGGADEVIREFQPQRVYTPEYKDDYITDPAHLWDNLYVYDNLIQAAQDTGAILIQNLDPNAPVIPAPSDAAGEGAGAASEQDGETPPEAPMMLQMTAEEITQQFSADPTDQDNPYNSETLPNGSIPVAQTNDPNYRSLESDPATTGNPCFTLGDMSIEIVNYGDSYKLPEGHTNDANNFAWGVVVRAFGQTAFLASDINNYDGDESNLVAPVEQGGYGLGHVELLKLAHHGLSGSNTPKYLKALSPDIAIQTASYASLYPMTVDILDELGTRHFDVSYALHEGNDAVVATFADDGISLNVESDETIWQFRWNSPTWTTYSNGTKQAQEEGWQHHDYAWYWFDEGTTSPIESQWRRIKGYWYYFNADASMNVGWLYDEGDWYYSDSSGRICTNCWKQVDGTWYLFNPSGAMQTGWVCPDGVNYYYLDPETGAMVTGWMFDGKEWYFMDDSGAMQTGWAQDGATWYYFNASGAMQTGWLSNGGAWYYLKPSGAMATGWLLDGSTWYYLASSGAMATGWVEVSGAWYYFNASGAMVSNAWVGNYYLKSDGSMAHGEWIGSYYVDETGAWVPSA